LKHRFQRDDFDDLHVAIQGLGAVGWGVAERLHAAGARLTVADVREERVVEARETFGAEAASPDEIHAVEADIYSPCALGGVIDETTVGAIHAKAVAGAANNQLATPQAGVALAARGVLYAPDYVLNAGGIISGLEAFFHMPGRAAVAVPPLDERLALIGDRLDEIFERSAAERRTPEVTAERMARELIGR
jgi:leucine dehydrogenase